MLSSRTMRISTARSLARAHPLSSFPPPSSSSILCRCFCTKTPALRGEGERESKDVSVHGREAQAHEKLEKVHYEEIKTIIERVSRDENLVNRPFMMLVNEVLGYISNQMEERKTKVTRWFGEHGNVNYVRDVSSLPDEDLPIYRRRFLDKTQNAAAPSKSYTERQRAANMFRLQRAKEDANNYARSEEQKWEDVFRPASLDGYGGVVESRILNGMRDFKPDGKEVEILKEAENPFLPDSEITLNRIMKKHGALPRWIELNKEIKEERKALQDHLQNLWNSWQKDKLKHKIASNTPFRLYGNLTLVQPLLLDKVKYLNKIILDFNLIVPALHLQKFGESLEEILQEWDAKKTEEEEEVEREQQQQQQQQIEAVPAM